jgi:hypothetical protein
LASLTFAFGNTDGFSFGGKHLKFDKSKFGNRQLAEEQQLLLHGIVELINDKGIKVNHSKMEE